MLNYNGITALGLFKIMLQCIQYGSYRFNKAEHKHVGGGRMGEWKRSVHGPETDEDVRVLTCFLPVSA